MPRRCLSFAAFSLVLVAAPCDAQPQRFVDAVRELAASAGIDPRQRAPIAPMVDRMASALSEWDRSLEDLRGRTTTELHGASPQRAFQMHVELGLAYRRRGRFADALSQFEAAAALRPEASDVHVLRALTCESAGDVDNAGRAFHTAWSLDPQNPVKAYYVVLYQNATDLARARQVLIAAYERGLKGGSKGTPFLTLDVLGDTLTSTTATASVGKPVVADGTLAQGFALLAAAKYNEAIEALRRSHALSSADDSPIAHFTRARSYEMENRTTDARKEYQAALSGTLSGRSLLYVGLGRLAQVDGDDAAAIDLLVRAVRLTPNDPLVHRELAGALAAADRIDDAFAELVAALLINPDDVSTTVAIGQLFLDNGRYDDAVTALRRTLQLAPDRFETHYALGAAMTHLGRTSEAAREFESFERARLQMVEKRRSNLDDPGGPR
ncbi:MAG TPA: tetratricopeptide repeat protein [Vicinamibacterales bacterium]